MSFVARDQLFVGGQWVKPSSAGLISVFDSASEGVAGTVPDPTKADMDRAIDAARVAFDRGPWPRMTLSERIEFLLRISAALSSRMEELALLITQEVGCTIGASRLGQAPSGARWFDYYASIAPSLPWRQQRTGYFGPPDATLVREPVGVVAAIAPWNGPLYLCCSKLAPALLAGCTVVLKPSPEAALDAYVLADAVAEAGLPDGVVSILPAGREVGEHLVSSSRIDKIAFTGSTAAGRRIASIAGERLTRISLELGGKSAAIVLEDADPAAVVPFVHPYNNGQACAQLSRVLVPSSQLDLWIDALAGSYAALRVGDPMDESVQVGPLVAEVQRDRVEGYLKLALDEGGKFAAGGGRPTSQSRGWFIEPTVITGLDNTARVVREEIFGPVISVLGYDTEAEAIDIANDSDYGLSCSVFTKDAGHGQAVVEQVRAGSCAVNGLSFTDIAKPFGGFKNSGIGREGGPEGLWEYTELKTLSVF